MPFKYDSVAKRIVSAAYGITSATVLTTSELLEYGGTPFEKDHILIENDRKRQNRLSLLDNALIGVIRNYDVRRLRCPIQPGSTVGTYSSTLWVNAGLADEEIARRQRLSLVPEYRELLFKLTPAEFEVVCQRLLEIIGCTGAGVTSFSKDDGVDAVAKLPMARILSSGSALYRLAGSISFFVFLQAKRHREDVPSGAPEVQSVLGAWEWMRKAHADRSLGDAYMKALEKADFRAADPVFLILATTSRFTSEAVKKAADVGMVTLDGEQIAQLLLEVGHGVRRTAGSAMVIASSAIVETFVAIGAAVSAD